LTDHQAVLLDAILQPRQVLESITVRAESEQLVASMTDIPLGTLPVTVQTVTSELINQQNATEIVTALNNVPGANALPALIAW
jgi:outer membrane receptor for monomeric catechols